MSTAVDVYARRSAKGDKEQRSVSGQVSSCLAVLKERGLTVGETHVDDGRSAWNPKVVRPGWEKLMARLEAGETGGVIVFDLERFTRQPEVEGGRLIKAAERGLVVLDSESEYDLTTTNGKKTFRDAMNAAAYYSDRISDRTKRGKRQKAMSGQVDAFRCFGFNKDGTINDAEATAIREAAVRLLNGDTQDAIIQEWQASIPTVKGAPWSYMQFRRVMTRPRVAGYLVHNGQIVEGVKLPAILDDVTWRRIVAMYARRKPGRQPSGRFMLTGLLMCARCKVPMAGRSINRTSRGNPRETSLRQYRCKQCLRTHIGAELAEDWAGQWAVKVLSDPEHADQVAARERALDARRGALLTEKQAIDADVAEVTARLGTPGWNVARVDLACKRLDARLGEIEGELASLDDAAAEQGPVRPLPKQDGTVMDAHEWAAWLTWAAWLDMPTADRRSAVRRALGTRKLYVGAGTPARFNPERITVC